MQDLTWLQWDAKSVYRGINQKYSQSIEIALNCYGSKIPRLEKMLAEEKAKYTELLKILRADVATLDGLEDIANLTRKINRLKDKRITCEKEILGRNLGTIIRDPKEFHNTVYYIDLDAGNDGADGLGTGTAWLTHAKYTTTTVRTAGDIAYDRANTDETMAADLNFDENGTQDALIQIIGCDSVTNDPWSDGSDVKPILSFGNGAYELQFDNSFWWIERLSIKDSNGYTLYISGSYDYFKDCEFLDAVGSYCCYIDGGESATFDGCTFANGNTYNIRMSGSHSIKFIDTTIDAGAGGTTYGIYAQTGSSFECVNTDFGQANAHGTADIYSTGGGVIRLRDCNITRAKIIVSSYASACIYEEDADTVAGAWFGTAYYGTIEKDTSVKTGNANFSFKMLPNTEVGPNNELTLNAQSIIDFPYVTYHAGGSEVTLTIKIRAVGTWSTYPTAAQLYMKTWYLDHAVNATRSVDVSTEVLSHASDWVSFTTTFTPLQAGNAYTEVRLGIFEDAGDGCYVNGEIVAS